MIDRLLLLIEWFSSYQQFDNSQFNLNTSVKFNTTNCIHFQVSIHCSTFKIQFEISSFNKIIKNSSKYYYQLMKENDSFNNLIVK